MRPLRVRASRQGEGFVPRKGEVVVMFYRDGTPSYACKIATRCAHSTAYLRSLVKFMQHKVPSPT